MNPATIEYGSEIKKTTLQKRPRVSGPSVSCSEVPHIAHCASAGIAESSIAPPASAIEVAIAPARFVAQNLKMPAFFNASTRLSMTAEP